MTKDTSQQPADEGAWLQRYHLSACAKYETLRGIYPNDRRLTGRACSCGLEAKISRRMAITESDLAWCLGKLRGLGSPAEQLEAKYGFTAQSQEEA